MTLSKIGQREYALTVDAIKKQLLSQNKIISALDGCTSTNKLAIDLVIVYYTDRNWELHEIQLAFYEVDPSFISTIESELWMISLGQSYWSKASRTFERRAWTFWAYWWPISWHYDC